MERHIVSDLSALPGYVGYKMDSLVAARRRPYSVVLFDEIERPIRVFNILLQVRKTDALLMARGELWTFVTLL